jgi:AraC-like DNA-binding protein
MVEHHYKIVKEILFQYSIDFGTSYYSQTEPVNKVEIIQEIVHRIKNYNLKDEYDERIIKIINYLNNNNLEYNQMINTLKGVTNLSESRLSHLFKFNLGISLKRYLIWTKLKSTIKQHLNQPEDLFTSLIKSGFYDHPHFSKNFKAMLGVKASKAYNSRTLQVLPILTS